MDGEPPTGISVRVASPDDRVAVARVLDGALLEVEDLGDRLATDCVLVATVERPAEGDGADGPIVGATVLAPEGPAEHSPPADWPAATHVRALAVRRKRRRNGIGSALLGAALAHWSPILADFDADVRPFYEALGAECRQGPECQQGPEDGQDPDGRQAPNGRHWALLRRSAPDRSGA